MNPTKRRAAVDRYTERITAVLTLARNQLLPASSLAVALHAVDVTTPTSLYDGTRYGSQFAEGDETKRAELFATELADAFDTILRLEDDPHAIDAYLEPEERARIRDVEAYAEQLAETHRVILAMLVGASYAAHVAEQQRRKAGTPGREVPVDAAPASDAPTP